MSRRTFLITGASKGIGRALSHRLHAAGHRVIGLARGHDHSFPGTLESVDLVDERATAEALTALTRRYEFDGVVNNAGLVKLHPVGEVELADVEALMRFNLHPAIQAVQALLPGMRERGWGRVVNLTSLVVLGMGERTGYAAAKAALGSFTRTWALELARSGITVNAVAPGPIETEMFRQNVAPGSEREEAFVSLIPMGRLGKPHEIAAAVDFFLSDDASFVTGQTLYVDGGGSIGRSLD
jgi:NAD(P)-dependent dehydrogenase (short-subunit alcohol dehydrogenase family)